MTFYVSLNRPSGSLHGSIPNACSSDDSQSHMAKSKFNAHCFQDILCEFQLTTDHLDHCMVPYLMHVVAMIARAIWLSQNLMHCMCIIIM